MAKNCLSILALTVIFIKTASTYEPIAKYLKPQILSNSEVVVNSGENHTIICQGNTPLNWTIPEVHDEEYKAYTKIFISEVVPQDEKFFRYGSKLFIENATYPFTGFYSCHDEHKTKAGVAKTYLYVRDEYQLSVTNTSVDTIIVTQYEDAVIPCRPTSPDVNVELQWITGETISDTFNPKTGFKFFVSSLGDEGQYICIFTRGSQSFEIFVYVKVLPLIDSLPKPLLSEINGGHTIVGDKLILHCEIRTHAQVSIEWKTPKGPIDTRRMQVSALRRNPDDEVIIYQNLTIGETKLTDNGVYYCIFHDNQHHTTNSTVNVKIYDVDEHFLNLTEENGVYAVSAMAGTESVQWKIDVDGHPLPKLSWINNKNEMIPLMDSLKYEISFTTSEAFLKIKNIEITDYGPYVLWAENSHENKSLEVFLNVTDKPSVHLEMDDFQMVGKNASVRCIVAAFPKPVIFLYYKNCQGEECQFKEVEDKVVRQDGFQVVARAHIKANQSGYVKCYAQNSVGHDEDIKELLISDVKNGLDIFGFSESIFVDDKNHEATIAIEDTIKMICGASVYNYTNAINWFFNGQPLNTNDDKYTLERSKTSYSYRTSLTVPQVDFSDGGLYSCLVNKKNGYQVSKNITLKIRNPVAPFVNSTNMVKNMEMKLPRPLEIFCRISGIPKPTIEWLKNNEKFTDNGHIKIVEDSQKLIFYYTEAKDEGVYKCEARNRLGRVAREMNLKFTNKPAQFNQWLFLVIAGLVVIVVFALIVIFYKLRNEKKLQRELKIAGLQNFEKGALENFNPELGIDDQAELLPYDRKWEFPIEKLKLGKQLGSGAFGVVIKGEAKGILDDEGSTTVAVKMVKRNADNTYIKALASELKIMVHLGKHLNVVNLLGACTKNVAKKELLVIVEYCRFGNLQNYLLRQRDIFIDQVDPKTGHIDFAIGQDILERTYSVSSNRSNPQSPYLKYAALTFNSANNGVPEDMVDYRGTNYSGNTSAKTETTTVNTGDEGVVLSNNSVQPEWRSNYRGDYKGNVRPICTKDLLAWAFQVSRGMEYLASRRVLHGDLAARNILLADNNVVKICDFGLAKTMYKNDNYKKKGNGPLPVKWMAIESIRDRIFSTQSDVWSFGIVLWEFFSLARTPYPGMEADERLYNKLLDGYRMESPEYSPKEIYKMMLDCWLPKPVTRPSFTKLAERIGSMLEDSVRKHYIDLNDPYLVMNTQAKQDGQSDYLSMLSPPNFENLSSPHEYINDQNPDGATPGYLCMKPSIFSPRVEDERIFDFNVDNKTKREPETLPMLSVNNQESDSESSCNSPNPNSFSNPSYHLPPVVEDVVKADNYVNMPKSKIIEKNNNPFVELEKDKKSVHYVNSEASRNWGSVNG